MAKKKSKTQKYKQNLKRKNKAQENKVKFVEANKVSYNVPITEPEKFKTKDKKLVEEKKEVKERKAIKELQLPRLKNEPIKKEEKKDNNKRTLVDKDKIIYNVPITNIEPKKKPKKNNNKRPIIQRPLTKEEIKEIKKRVKEKEELKQEAVKEEIKQIKEQKKKNRIELLKKRNILFRLFYEIKNKMFIFFDVALVLFILVTILGLVKTNVFETGTIIYITVLILFLSIIAISYNKHIEGRVFTILLCVGMGFAIYRMQYTYDFIRALNTAKYESKTYYVIALDNAQNKSIYNINNKKVGLINNNTINVERMLSTKIEATYIEYDDINKMFNDFYEQKFRAVIVTENEYKYLENNATSKPVKIIYEFSANCKK